MTFEIVSTQSWNVLGTFEDEQAAQAAVSSSLREGGATVEDLVVYVTDDAGEMVLEYHDGHLGHWAGAAHQWDHETHPV
jgi:hypothetical protein